MKEKKQKKAGKVKVVTKKKELTITQLKQKGINILPENYLNGDEKNIFTRIDGKDVRSWKMTLSDFLKLHKGKEIFIYPNDKKIHWEFNGKLYIRGYAI